MTRCILEQYMAHNTSLKLTFMLKALLFQEQLLCASYNGNANKLFEKLESSTPSSEKLVFTINI